jgi:hypothetical protein
MRKFVLVAALMFTVSFLGGCATLEGWFGDSRPVVTSSANVADGVEAATVPVASLPESVRKLIPEGMDVVVINREDLVSEDAPHIPLVGEFDDTAIGTAFDAGMHIAKTFLSCFGGLGSFASTVFPQKASALCRCV